MTSWSLVQKSLQMHAMQDMGVCIKKGRDHHIMYRLRYSYYDLSSKRQEL